MLNKKLGLKKLTASIAVNDELIIPYTRSQVFAEFDEKTDELYILIKDTSTSKTVKLFFKDAEKAEIIKDEPKEDKSKKDAK